MSLNDNKTATTLVASGILAYIDNSSAHVKIREVNSKTFERQEELSNTTWKIELKLLWRIQNLKLGKVKN